MFSFLETLLSNVLVLALHLEKSMSFPKPLNEKEERECFEQIANGDEAARAKMIEHNLRLIAHIAKKYSSSGVDSEDLLSIGTIGLIKAVSTFNYLKGTRFATYASKCIENEILMYFRSLKKTGNEVYFDDPIDTDKDGNTLTLMDIIAKDDNVIDKIDLSIKTKQLYEFIDNSLDSREREIIILRYGLFSKKPLTQREVASRFKISRSYVSRIEKKALLKLREKFEKNGGFSEYN